MANQKNESALIKKVKDIANVMASAGVGFTDYITQLTYIISVLREYDVKSKGVDSNCEEGELLKEMIYKITR